MTGVQTCALPIFSGTNIVLPSSLYIIGIGHPQYLCREIPQSFSRYIIFEFPIFFSSNFSIIFFFASMVLKLLINSELIAKPSSGKRTGKLDRRQIVQQSREIPVQ